MIQNFTKQSLSLEKRLSIVTHTSNNFIIFKDENYIRVSGTVIGDKYAPSYATIFMGMFEQNLLSSVPKKPLIWYCFIDNIFMIWTHSEEDLANFITHTNNLHPTIKFTSERSRSEIAFLDKLETNGNITMDLHTKPTDKHMYLQTN